MVATITDSATLVVGVPVVIQSQSPTSPYTAAFEDDGDAGYFYACDFRDESQPILDASHVCDVRNVADGDCPSTVETVWSRGGLMAALRINGYAHAAFDFQACRAYCRTGFPPPRGDGPWTKAGRDWDEAALQELG